MDDKNITTVKDVMNISVNAPEDRKVSTTDWVK
jgi:hypothetical protein